MARFVLLRAALGLGDSGVALAQPAPPWTPVSIDCAALTLEQAAEVEARARAELLASDMRATDVRLGCDPERVAATVRDDELVAEAERPSDGPLSDVLIQAFNEALRQLQRQQMESPEFGVARAVAASPAPAEGVAPPRPPPPTPALPPAAPPPRGAGDAARHQRQLDLAGGVALEAWNGEPASGALLEASYGGPRLALTWRLGALWPVKSARAFSARDLEAELGFDWEPPWSRGLRLQAGAGASLLSATPRGAYEPRGVTHVGAGFLLLAIGRPIWLHPWALVPEAGVRLFAGERRINLDSDARLVIGVVTPRLGLSLRRRFD